MLDVKAAITIDAVRQFLKLHATCGGVSIDTPVLPNGSGYRVLAACRCGDTTEHWLTDAALPRHCVIDALSRPPGSPLRSVSRAA